MGIKDPKERLFAIMDRQKELKDITIFRQLTDNEDLELRNLDAQNMIAYSEWKDFVSGVLVKRMFKPKKI